MLRLPTACAMAGLIAVAVVVSAHPKADQPRFTFVDLRPKANHHLTDRFGRIPGNNLASLPTGEQTFTGVKFNVENDVIQLHSQRLPEPRDPRIEGIAVGR